MSGEPFASGTSATMQAGKGKIWLSDLRCPGDKEDIFICLQAKFGVNNCTHSQDVLLSVLAADR